MPGTNINFVTSNKLKFDIARAYFAPFGDKVTLRQLDVDIPEIQAETVEEVAVYSAKEAARQTGEPCIVSDAGFVIEALRGFPGPFVKYVNQWLGVDGYLRLLDGVDDRSCYWEDALAVAFPDGSSQVFMRREHGTVAKTGDSSASGWAGNNLFIPDGHTVPLGQLSHEDQVAFWGDGRWPDVVKYLQEREAGVE